MGDLYDDLTALDGDVIWDPVCLPGRQLVGVGCFCLGQDHGQSGRICNFYFDALGRVGGAARLHENSPK